MNTLLRVGAETFDLGPPVIMAGLLATIGYRLEPDGRGSRFPVVMKRLYAGRVGPADVTAACRELEEIDAGLAKLPPDRAVWSLSDLSRCDDSQLPVNHNARNVREYFVAGDGRPLVTVLRDAARLSEGRHEPVVLVRPKPVVRIKFGNAWTLTIIGFLVTVVTYLFFPHYTTSANDSSTPTGPLIWPMGIFVFGYGVFCLANNRYPAIQERAWLPALVMVMLFAAFGLYLVLGWN